MAGTTTHGLQAVSAPLVALLAQLANECTQPEQARARLRRLATAYPELALDLSWEGDDYDQTTHYDVIARAPGVGALVVGFCPARAVPFVARGATRFDDDDLLSVDGLKLSVQSAVERLELNDDAKLTRPLVDGLLLDRALEELGIADEEPPTALLQRALDDFRYKQGLLRADQVHDWLARRGMSLAVLERSLERAARIHLLRARIAQGAHPYFVAHGEQFRRLALMRIRALDRATAEHLCAARDAETFERALLDALDAGGEQHCASAFTVDVAELPSADPDSPVVGSLLGPFTRATGFEVLRVLATTPARWDTRTRERVEQLLFERWLEEQRQRATIRWGWGTVTARNEEAR